MKTNTLPSLLVLGACIFMPPQSRGYSRQGVWNNVSDPKFPIVPVYGCPGRFATNFPGVPWANILSQAQLAMNEWFIGGGADVRMRYESDLADNDPRCVNESPDVGTILLSAERNNGGGQCYLATTFYDQDGSGNNTTSLVIMHAGTVCNGTFQAWAWATNADYPQNGQFDFQSIFLHELGHAIGFNHSSDANAVMYPYAPNGVATKRTLADDDVRGLFGPFPYNPTQLNMYDVWTSNGGASWNRNTLGSSNLVGSPAACVNNDTNSDTYQGVWSGTYPYQTVNTFTFQTGYAFGETISAGSDMSPGIACGSDRTWYGWVNALTGDLNYYWNVNGGWSRCTLTYADGNFHTTPMIALTLAVTPSTNPAVTVLSGTTPIAGSDGYGGAVQDNNTGGGMSVWRDRGFNTVLASTINGTINWSTITVHGPPSLAWANHYNTQAAFYSYADRYNTH